MPRGAGLRMLAALGAARALVLPRRCAARHQCLDVSLRSNTSATSALCSCALNSNTKRRPSYLAQQRSSVFYTSRCLAASSLMRAWRPVRASCTSLLSGCDPVPSPRLRASARRNKPCLSHRAAHASARVPETNAARSTPSARCPARQGWSSQARSSGASSTVRACGGGRR